MPVVSIDVGNVGAIVRQLRQVNADLPKALRLTMNQIAGLVVDDARSRVPRRSGRAASSIRAASTQRGVRIKAGGRRAPYFPFLDYGGRVGRNHSVRRPYIADGRFLYPAARAQRGQVERVLRESLADVVRRAGLQID